jgi:hypothetical protein
MAEPSSLPPAQIVKNRIRQPLLRLAPPVALNYTLGSEEITKVYNIHNSLPYAEPLANGSSKQANAGWVDLVAKQMTKRARQLANSIGRQD